MARKLNSLRSLEAQGITYKEVRFPDTVLSAIDVAEHLGLPAAQVYKTLVVLPLQGKPLLVMVASDREVHLKGLAQALGEKKLRMATQKEAEALTGLKVEGLPPWPYNGEILLCILTVQPRTWTRFSLVLVSVG